MRPSTLFLPLLDRVALLGTVNTNHGEISRTPHVDKLPFISIEPGQEAIMFPYCGTEQHRDDFQVISNPQEEPLHLTDLTSRCPFPTTARPLSLHNLVSPISGLPTHLYQAHLYRAHLYQTSFLPSSKYGRTHSGKLALTGDPGAGAPTHDFCLRQKSFGLFSIVPGPPW